MSIPTPTPHPDEFDIDAEIHKIVTRPHLVDRVQKEKAAASRASEDVFSLKAEIREHPGLYTLLGLSAIFSGSLGIYIGLSPRLAEVNGITVVQYQTGFFHVLQALVLACVFIGMTEGAFAMAKFYFNKREDGNMKQTVTSFLAGLIAAIAIVGTGIAGGSVLASYTSFMTGFVEVPDAAQKWIVYGIPSLIAIYAVLFTVYTLSSKISQARRVLRQERDMNAIDQEFRQETIMMAGTELLQKAALARYLGMVKEGKLTAAEARARFLADNTLGETSAAEEPTQPVPHALPAPTPTNNQAAAWKEVNDKLEDVKQGLLQAAAQLKNPPLPEERREPVSPGGNGLTANTSAAANPPPASPSA